jgi:hypothetical protein
MESSDQILLQPDYMALQIANWHVKMPIKGGQQ